MKPKLTCPLCKEELTKYDAHSQTFECDEVNHYYIYHLDFHKSLKKTMKYLDCFYDCYLNFEIEIYYYKSGLIKSKITDCSVDPDKVIKTFNYKIEIDEDLFNFIKEYRLL